MKVTGLRVVGRFVIRKAEVIPVDMPFNAMLDEDGYPLYDEYKDYILDTEELPDLVPENALLDPDGDPILDPNDEYILDDA